MDEFNRELIEFEVGISLPSIKVIQVKLVWVKGRLTLHIFHF